MTEMVQVYDVARPRLAPVEHVGKMRRINDRVDIDVVPGVQLAAGDRLLLRPGPGSPWRTGRGVVLDVQRSDLSEVCAWAEGDDVYRIGKPTTPSLEERVADLERIVGELLR